MSEQHPSTRLGPIELAKGISKLNTIAFLYGDFAAIGLLVFINIGQVYVLNENLGIPRSEQGTISGDLQFFNEIVILAVIGIFGVLSDRIGRRTVMAFGIAMIGVSYIFYPLADSVTDLYVYRVIYAVGVAAATVLLTVLVHDYVKESSRGKLVAASGIMGGLGSIIVVTGSGQLPAFFRDAGASALAAGQYAHWLVAAIALVSAAVIWFGLAKGAPTRREEQPPLGELLRIGIREAKNPRVALSYATAFVARGDMVIMGTFLVLWGSVAGGEQGLDNAEAVSRGSLLYAQALSASLPFTVVLFFLLDRFNRVTVVMIGNFLATAGFLSMGLIDDPLASGLYPLFALLGIGQISCFLSSQALIGQEANDIQRGSVIGVFSFMGAVGILVASIVGGRMFDAIGPSSPFVMVGCATGLLFIASVVVRLKSPGPMPMRAGAKVAA